MRRAAATALAIVVLTLSAAGWSRSGRAAPADSPPLTYRLALPAIAADSGTLPADSLRIEHVVQALDAGFLVVSGEVRNTLPYAVRNVQVRGELAAGTAQGSAVRTGEPVVDDIAPGASVPFYLLFPAVEDASRPVSFTVTTFEPVPGTSAAGQIELHFDPPKPMPILIYDPKTQEPIYTYSDTTMTVDGTVKNTGDRPLTGIEVVAVLFAADGHVSLVASSREVLTHVQDDAGTPILAPGEAATFHAHLPTAAWTATGLKGTVRVFVNATFGN